MNSTNRVGQLVPLDVDGLETVGPGLASQTAWIVAVAVLVLLAVLAWWTMRPARRASAAERRAGRVHDLTHDLTHETSNETRHDTIHDPRSSR